MRSRLGEMLDRRTAAQQWFDAARAGNVEVLQSLTARKMVKLDARGNWGKTALYTASEAGHTQAVALLLDLANVEESSYTKEHPDTAWPPPAAYTIAAECGLLPVTLTIAAQVVRSWGDGWGE